MLKGLEISEVNLSEVKVADASIRIDAEFYKSSDIVDLKRIEKLPHAKLREVTEKIDVGFVGAMSTEYTDDKNAPILLQTRNIKEFIVDDADVIHINRSFHDYLCKSQIHRGDILIARSGSFGNAAIWLKREIVNSSDIIIASQCDKSIFLLISLFAKLIAASRVFSSTVMIVSFEELSPDEELLFPPELLGIPI